jgi:hypothetical protein
MMNDEQLRALREPPPTVQEEAASEPQLNYIRILVEDRMVPKHWLLQLQKYAEEGMTKPKAGEIIGKLKSLPRAPQAHDDREGSPTQVTPKSLPSGRYAVELKPVGDEDNDIAFYRVKWNKTETRYWVSQIVGPNERPVEHPRNIIKQIIRQGVGNCAALYGFKIGKCSICHTRITNRLSRALGIGPICGGRVFEDWEERVNTTRQALIERGLDPTENIE